MPYSSFTLAYHIDQLTRLQQAGHVEALTTYYKSQLKDVQLVIEPWYQHLVQRFEHSNESEQLPKCDYLRIKGWQAFYQHQYVQAQSYFNQALQEADWQIYATDASLGLAKVYTRTGHWQLARDWCLCYLQLARQHLHHFDLAKGYGALAEIFLRADKPMPALACFQFAFHLMPIQHGQQARQYNFMASALMRNEEWLRAEVLLRTSQQISRNILLTDPDNNEAKVSQLHSIMRLAFIKLFQKPSLTSEDVLSITHMLDPALPSSNQPVTGLFIMPIGMLWVAKGILAMKQSLLEEALSNFAQAMQIFENKLPMEYYWAKKLYACTQNIKSQNQDNRALDEQFYVPFDLTALSNNSPTLPKFENIVDLTWQQDALPAQGFQSLFASDMSEQQQLLQRWKLFFI